MATLSGDAIKALYASQTGESFHYLLTLDHGTFAAPERLCDDVKDITSNGDVYEAYPLVINFPADEAGRIADGTITIDNVARKLVTAVRSLSTPMSVRVQLVRGKNPDDVMVDLTGYTLRDIQGNVGQITGRMTLQDFDAEPFPHEIFSPAQYPGVF